MVHLIRKFTFSISILLLFSMCSNQGDILIGYVGGLTGIGSELGRSGMYGALLAVEDVNAAGGVMGRNIRLEIKDDKSNSEVAVKVDQELYDLGCRIIIGHMISGVSQQAVAFANERKILMISPTIATDALTGIDDYFIRLIPDNLTQAQLISKHIGASNVNRLAIIQTSSNLAFSQVIIDFIRNDLSKKGVVKIDTITYDSSKKMDYFAITQQLIALKADGVVILTPADETSRFAQVFKLSNFTTNVFLPAWAMTNDLLHWSGKTAEGFYGVNYVNFDSQDEKFVVFEQRYFQYYGNQPTFSSILAYESVMVAVQAMQSVKSTIPLRVKTEILKIKDFVGISGKFEIDSFGDVHREISLFQIRNGKFTKVSP